MLTVRRSSIMANLTPFPDLTKITSGSYQFTDDQLAALARVRRYHVVRHPIVSLSISIDIFFSLFHVLLVLRISLYHPYHLPKSVTYV